MYDLKMDRAAPESTFSMRKGRSSLNVAMIGAVSCTTCLITMEVQAEREGLSGKGSLILWTLSSSRNISLHEMSFKFPFGACQPHIWHMCFDIRVRFHPGFSVITCRICSTFSSVISGRIRFSINSPLALIFVSCITIRH